jgi:hypothetical protein
MASRRAYIIRAPGWRAPLPCAISPYFISDGAFARALPGGQRSSPTRPNQEQLSHFARAVAFEPQLPYSPPVLIHLVAPLGTHLLDVESPHAGKELNAIGVRAFERPEDEGSPRPVP